MSIENCRHYDNSFPATPRCLHTKSNCPYRFNGSFNFCCYYKKEHSVPIIKISDLKVIETREENPYPCANCIYWNTRYMDGCTLKRGPEKGGYCICFFSRHHFGERAWK